MLKCWLNEFMVFHIIAMCFYVVLYGLYMFLIWSQPFAEHISRERTSDRRDPFLSCGPAAAMVAATAATAAEMQ